MEIVIFDEFFARETIVSISSATKKWKTSFVFLPPELSGYLRNSEGTNNISFLAEDEKLLRKTIKYGVKFKILRGKNWLIIQW